MKNRLKKPVVVSLAVFAVTISSLPLALSYVSAQTHTPTEP